MKKMKDEQDLMDSLMKEHAEMKRSGKVDEKFLSDLEERLDAEELLTEDTPIVVAMPMTNSNINSDSDSDEDSPISGSARRLVLRLGLGLGLAACATFGFLGYQQMNDRKGDMVLDNQAVKKQLETSGIKAKGYKRKSVGKDAWRKEDSYSQNDVLEEAELIQPKVTNQVNKQPAAPSASVAKVIAANTPSPVAVPVPELTTSEPSLDFGVSDEFGDGWGGENLAMKKIKRRQADVKRERELYGKLIENGFKAPLDKDRKLSTFAVDVDTASYTNFRRMVQSGQQIPKDAVRIEEMVNYFDYQYAQPIGKHPFAVHLDTVTCPWNADNKLVQIALQGKDIVREVRPASNIVFLLDVSGSMHSDDKLPLLKQSLTYLLEELNENDKVSIVVYAGASGVVLPATAVTYQGRTAILDSLSKLSAGGSTAGGQGIKLAYKIAQEHFIKGGVNRVILATDGDFNVGVSDTESLTELVKKRAKGGVYLSALGFGQGNLNDEMIESITNNGNGNYSYIDSIKEGRKVLLEDMMGTMVTIAKDVKIQVEFNPTKVKEYRLIGYSNRMLPNKAFYDKKADAGEIGAGHQVTAFYEIVPGNAMERAEEEKLRYTNRAEKKEVKPEPVLKNENNDELLYVKLAYKLPEQKVNDESTYLSVPLIDADKPWQMASEDLKFSASAALLGMVIRDSEHKGNGSIDLVEQLAEAGKGPDGKGYRQEFIEIVKKLKARE